MTDTQHAAMVSELQDSTARFLASEVPGTTLQQIVQGDGFSADLWRQAAEMGWFRLLLPEEHGGLGLSLGDVGFLFREVGRQPFPGPLVDHAVVVPLLIPAAPPPLRARLVESLDGDRLVTLADPCVDADPRRRDDSLRVADGSLDGTVPFVRFADRADDFVLFVQGDGGPAILMIDHERRGVAIAPAATMDPGGPHATLELRNVVTGEDDVIAIGEEAEAIIGRLRASLQLMMACELSGLAGRMFDMTLDYAKVRHQFGRTIGSFQAVKHILADMFVRANSLDNLCVAALDDVTADEAVLARSAVVAKAYGAKVSRSVAEDALQLHGGIGFTMEHALHLYLKRTFALQGCYGDERELATRLGHALLERGARRV